MKIVHICQYYQEGLGYQENLLPLYQKKLGHDVVIITSDRVLPPFKRLKGQIHLDCRANQHNEVPVIRLQTVSEFKNRFVVFKNLMQVLEAERPDYIFHHGLTAPSLITAVEYKSIHKRVFLAVDTHSDLGNSGKNLLWRMLYYKVGWRMVLRRLLKYIDIVFGVTPSCCIFAEKFLGVPFDKLRLLPLGIDSELAREVLKNNREGLRKSYGYGLREFLIITGGKISREKGIDKLVDAFELLNEEFGQNRLIIFGVVDDESLKNKIKRANNIDYVGWKTRKEFLELLYISDVAVWPYSVTTLIEDAMAVSTPLILKYNGSTCHRIGMGNGLFIYEGSVREIYDKLRHLYVNPTLVDSMRKKAHELARELSYENIAKESLDYYYDISPKWFHNLFFRRGICDVRYRRFLYQR